MLAKMVQEGRIDARIDQEFQGAVFRSQSALGRWDKRISTICGLVNEAVDLIGAKGLLPA